MLQGSTYGFPAVASTPECSAACLADARCSAWTYINGPSSPSRSHLKTAGLNRVRELFIYMGLLKKSIRSQGTRVRILLEAPFLSVAG